MADNIGKQSVRIPLESMNFLKIGMKTHKCTEISRKSAFLCVPAKN